MVKFPELECECWLPYGDEDNIASTFSAATPCVFIACCLNGHSDKFTLYGPMTDILQNFDEAALILSTIRKVLGSNASGDT